MKRFQFFALVVLLVGVLLLVVLMQKTDHQPIPGSHRPALQDSLLFYRLCDHFVEGYPAWDRENYRRSYAVRALAVAYDRTADSTYLQTCLAWSDSMLLKQADMTPAGAYYMGYFRRPGETSGQWFVADASCIAMAVLATAVRCEKETDQLRYLASVQAFAELVIERYVRDSGGITDGIWDDSDEEWWCSTALFTSLLFLLYEQTGEAQYLQVALDAVDWLCDFDYRQATTPAFDKQGAPTVVFYTLEAFTAGLAHFQEPRLSRVKSVFQEYIDWVVQNIDRDYPAYIGNWGAKIGGLPFHLLIYQRFAAAEQPERAQAAGQMAREILDYIAVAPLDDFQRSAFAAFSLCEAIEPDAVYHRK
ncbi:hypothetical protein JW992_04475 [candidate division KSB1 bacterium]|nr:hypothetical protein [candidate division KSB1 bacterium]